MLDLILVVIFLLCVGFVFNEGLWARAFCCSVCCSRRC